ncbi:MAG: diaminopimelate epimerase [Rhodospirillaceae bacterium]|nr:diaminopimelate epimerase [Rhodospirillaceae bacterium]
MNSNTDMSPLDFVKMHGLGNDFVILDRRLAGQSDGESALSLAARRAISDRHIGVGCDQLIVLEPPKTDIADVFMRIYNPDGSEAGACGNATRCVASRVMAENSSTHVIVETIAGLLDCQALGDGNFSVDMGPAQFDWRDVPLANATDTQHLDLEIGPLRDPVALSMGNPHTVFFVDDVQAIDLAGLGPEIENHAMFPERTNVEVVQVIDQTHLRMRVWERGAGITRACGSGACAALVAAASRGLCDRQADVQLDGGVLNIHWLVDNNVLMSGPVATSFSGRLDASLLGDAK